MKFVLKIGGSLLFDENQNFDIPRFKAFAQVVRQIKHLKHELIIVVGGGVLAKLFVEKGKELEADHDALDQLGIAATWVCAQLLIASLYDISYFKPIMNEDELLSLQTENRLLIFGGLRPGQSTNAVAARVAELTKSPILVNVTDVDGVYDKDPKRIPGAKLLPKITINQLRELVASLAGEPGTYPLFDKRALEIIERAHIEVWFINGSEPENILKAIENGKIGTRVVAK